MPIGPTEGHAQPTAKITRARKKLELEVAKQAAAVGQLRQITGSIKTARDIIERANRPHDVPKGEKPSAEVLQFKEQQKAEVEKSHRLVEQTFGKPIEGKA